MLSPSLAGASGLKAVEIPSIPPGVRLVTLDHGLTIIVRENHSAPVVSAQAWCRAGSIDEGKWLGAGLSHVLEHMLFKGTTGRGTGRIDQEVQAAGGYMNAYTSFDRTVYWINVPNTGARVAIDILCDIMQHATLPEETLANEMDVIRREMDMCHDDPSRRASRRLFETAYTRSPYRFTIIGYPNIFNQLTRDDIVGYYREKYVPNNLLFTVAGDVQADEVIEQIRAAFASARARPLPPAVLPAEPRQIAPREVIEEAPIQLAHLHFSWHIPDLRHPDVPVLDVLATLLGGGRSSRLYQEVRERQGLVQSVDAWAYNPGELGLLGMSAVMEAPKLAEARAAMLAEVRRMQDEPVGNPELAKAVKQFVAATLATHKTMQGQAQDLGASWLAAGDLNFSERYLAAVKGITPADLQRVARKYLTADGRTLYALAPAGTAPKPASASTLADERPVEKFDLPNGLRLLVKESHRLPFVELRLVMRGGVLAETPANNGLTQLLSRMLLQGTRSRTAAQVVTEIESLGGHIDTYSGNNSFGLNVEVLSADFQTGLELLADVLLHPAFPADALERERQNQLAALKAQRDQLLQSGDRLLRRALFGQQAYGLDPLGAEESLAGLAADDLQRFHQRLVAPQNAVLAIYGDIEPAAVRTAVEAVFAEWRGPRTSLPPPPPAPAPSHTPPRLVVDTRDKKQAVLLIGFPAVRLDSPDRFALDLIQESCGDLGSRLFMSIREKLGLAYYVGAQNFPGLVPGYFAFYAGTSPESAARAEAELFRETGLLASEGLTEAELERAKAKLIGQKKIAKQDLGSYAQACALDELYGLGYRNTDLEDAKYQAVTLGEVQAAASRYLRPEAAVVVRVQPEAETPAAADPPSSGASQ
jgi:zinc protease